MPRGGSRIGAGGGPKKKPKADPQAELARKALEPFTSPDELNKVGDATPVETSDSKEFLEMVMRGQIEASISQIRAAMSLLPFQHPKLGEGGKKEARKDAAEKVSGRFAPSAPPPRLVAAAGKKV